MSGAPALPIFFNASAGLEPLSADALARQLDLENARLYATQPAELADAVRAAAAAGEPIIGVAGGDGSLRAAASALVRSETALAAIPTGTLNTFAKRCGIADIASAGEALRARRVRALPLGSFDGDIFLNTLTLGEYARIVRIRERWRSVIGKWPAALIGFFASLCTARRFEVTLETDGRRIARRTPFIWVGLGWGSFPRVSEALERRREPDLEVGVLRAGGRGAAFAFVLRVAWRLLRGQTPVRDDAFELLHTRSVRLVSPHLLDGTADGEVIRVRTPIDVRVVDEGIRVVVR